MQPQMTKDEIQCLSGFLACTDKYLEFGTGGSTCLAASLVHHSIVSVDSSSRWIDAVRETCAAHADWVQPNLVHVDIGSVGDWGWPIDPAAKARWPNFHSQIWENSDAIGADLVMLDGRFRVACFLQTILRARPDALIAIHDFANRAAYHAVHQFGREIARVDELSIFVRRPGCDMEAAHRMLTDFAHNPT